MSEKPWLNDIDISQLPEAVAECVDNMAEVLWTFRWIDPRDPDGNQGEVRVRTDDEKAWLELHVMTHTSENGETPSIMEVVASTQLNAWSTPIDQVRNIIHWHICQEADRLMEFDRQTPFWPPEEEEL